MRTSIKARTVLICFGAAILALAIGLAAAALFQSLNKAEQNARLRVAQLALDLSADIDRDLQRHVVVLNTLATLPSLAAADWPTFYGQATEALRGDGYIVLTGRDMHQIVNTYVPYGQAPATTGDPETVRRVLQSNQPQVSDRFVSLVTHTAVFNVDVPVVRDGQVEYVLSYGRKVDYLDGIIADQGPSTDWSRAIVDRKGAVLAASTPGSDEPSEGTDAPNPNDLHAQARSPFSGWTVHVRGSPEVVVQSARSGLFALAGGVSVLLLVAVGGSVALGKLFARDLERTAAAAHALAHGAPVTLAGSAIAEIDVVGKAIFDASGKLAERDREQEVLRRELQHRVGNMIAVVQALVVRLSRTALAPEQLRAALVERLDALARAQALIVRRDWHNVRLRDILQQELSAFSENFSIVGPDVLIEGGTVQTFALLVHELATNAVKHGALRTADGAVRISLGITHGGDAMFSFLWEERGSAPAASDRKGFGTQLLETVFAHPATQRRREILPEGLVFELRVPADAFQIATVAA